MKNVGLNAVKCLIFVVAIAALVKCAVASDAFLTVCLLVIVACWHELSHAMMGAKLGIPFERMQIGLGPALFKIKLNNSAYALAPFPIGAAVIYSREQEAKLKEPKNMIRIAAMGPISNIIVGVILTVIVGSVIGLPKYTDEPVIGMVGGAPAAGKLFPGDRIESVDGTPITTWTELSEKVGKARRSGKKVDLELLRQGNKVEVSFPPPASQANWQLNICAIQVAKQVRRPVGQMLSVGWIMIWSQFSIPIKMLTTPTGRKDLRENVSGPVGIVEGVTDMTAGKGALAGILEKLMVLNLIVGCANLLPLFPFDGGRVLMGLVSLFTRRRFDHILEPAGVVCGFLCLGFILYFVVRNDLQRLFG